MVYLWSTSLVTAEEELKTEFQIQMSMEEYYTKMCTLGKHLLADELNKRTQRIYDVRASRKFSKEFTGKMKS